MIHIEVKGIKELQAKLDPRKVEKSARSALTRVKEQAKTEAVRSITKVWNIKQGDVLKKGSGGERIKSSSFVGSDLSVYISFYSGGISLAYFGATEFRFRGNQLVKVNRKVGKMSKRRGDFQGVKVKLLKGGKEAKLKGFLMAVAYGKNSGQGYHLGVFSRHSSGKRLPVYERKMISVATMIRKPEVIEPLKKFIGEKFQERFNHELKRQGLTS